MSDSAIAVPIRQILGGREFEFVPLTMYDLGRVRRWVVLQRAQSIRDLYGDKITDKLHTDLMREILYPQADISLREIMGFLQEPDAQVYLLWYSAHKQEAGLILEEFALFCKPAEIEKIMELSLAVAIGGSVKEIEIASEEVENPPAAAAAIP